MSKLEEWSTTAASNDLTVPEGWPEGMSPGNVNNVGRQTMARLREWYQDAEWIALGHTINSASGDTMVLAGDVSAYYSVGRMLRADGVIGYVTDVSVSTNTTVEVAGITFAGPPVVFEVGILASSLKRSPGDFAVGGALTLTSPPTFSTTGMVTSAASFDGHSNLVLATTFGSGAQRYLNQARGLVSAAGVISNGSGVTAASLVSTGRFRIDLNFQPIGAVVTLGGSALVAASPGSASHRIFSNRIDVHTFDSAGAPESREFFILVFGP